MTPKEPAMSIQDKLLELRELSEKATAYFPWSHDKGDARIFDGRGFVLANSMGGAIRSANEHDANCDFIVACVNYVRKLLRESKP